MSLSTLNSVMSSPSAFHLGSYWVPADNFSGGYHVAYLYPRHIDNDLLLVNLEDVHEPWGNYHALLSLKGFPLAISAANVFECMKELDSKLSFRTNAEIDLWGGRVQDIWSAVRDGEDILVRDDSDLLDFRELRS